MTDQIYDFVADDVQIEWRECDSSNVRRIGWPKIPNNPISLMLVEFKNGHIYAYQGVSRQRAVAAWLSRSTGSYLNKRIKPTFPSVQVKA